MAWRLNDAGNEHYMKGEFDKALTCYTTGLQLKDPIPSIEESVTLYRNRSTCYLRTNEFERAVKDCDIVLAIYPGDAKSLRRRSQAQEQLGRYDKAYKDALEVHRFEPKDNSIQLNRLSAKIQEAATKRAIIHNKVHQMFELILGVNAEKRLQAANNLIVVAKDQAGSAIMVERYLLKKFRRQLKVEKNDEIIIALTRAVGELSSRRVSYAEKILSKIGLSNLINLFNSENKERVDAAVFVCQSLIDTFSGMGTKHGQKADNKLLEKNEASIDEIMTGLTCATNSRVFTTIGRQAVLDTIVKNVDCNALNWAVKLLDRDGVYRILEVASELKAEEYVSNMEIAATVSLLLMKMFEALSCPNERYMYQEKVDEFVIDKLKGPEREARIRVTAAITVLLLGPLDIGNHCLSENGVINMLLVMAGSGDVIQQTVAAEAINAAVSKSDKCTGILNMGHEILMKLYQSEDEGVKVRAVAGLSMLELWSIEFFDGHDAYFQPFANGSQNELYAVCRRCLVTPWKDHDIRKWAAEGLACLTIDADIKEQLMEDEAALRSFVDLANKGDMSTVFGVVTTLAHLTNSYMPKMSPKDNHEYVANRIKAITDLGIIVGLVRLSKTQDNRYRELISRIFNAICGIEELRGTVVEQGGAKVLLNLALEGSEKGEMAAAQALARIAITVDNEIAFPGEMHLEVIRPMIQLLHASRESLEKFDAIVGLTYIAVRSPSARNLIVSERGIMGVEMYMYKGDVVLKRVATECIANLVNSEEAVRLHTLENDRVKYLMWLTTNGDMQTAVAAAAALVNLTSCSVICCEKVFQHKDWIDILRTMVANENKDLQHRGTCIVRHMITASKEIAQKLVVEAEIIPLLQLVAQQQLEDPASAVAKWSINAIMEYGLNPKDGEQE